MSSRRPPQRRRPGRPWHSVIPLATLARNRESHSFSLGEPAEEHRGDCHRQPLRVRRTCKKTPEIQSSLGGRITQQAEAKTDLLRPVGAGCSGTPTTLVSSKVAPFCPTREQLATRPAWQSSVARQAKMHIVPRPQINVSDRLSSWQSGVSKGRARAAAPAAGGQGRACNSPSKPRSWRRRRMHSWRRRSQTPPAKDAQIVALGQRR